MKKYIFFILALLVGTQGCNDDAFLNVKPSTILSEEEVFADPRLVLSALTDLYNQIPDLMKPSNSSAGGLYASFDEAFGSGDYAQHRFRDYSFDAWFYWDYTYIRQINLFIERAERLIKPNTEDNTSKFKLEDKQRFIAEARYLRANAYFELVKRMGGVPLILNSLTYEFTGDASNLRRPRAKEVEIYDFVLSEMEVVKPFVPNNPNEKSRVTVGLVLATKARVALYAGSIAKYGATTPDVSMPGGEVGIPADRAQDYYTMALAAAQELIASGQYALYQRSTDLSANFANLFLEKSNNPEAIFVEDFKIPNKIHAFALDNQPRAISEDGIRGGRLNPSLNLMQSFEKLDNTFAPFNIGTVANPVYYDKPEDLFAGRDARLRGTALVPGSLFKDKPIDIFAGIILADGSIPANNNKLGEIVKIGGESVQVVGLSGPISGVEGSAQGGFYMRKYNDPSIGSGQIGTQSDVWWIRYRYAEVLLNAAEAAFELNNKDLAATYMNQVRARAGLTQPLVATDITFDRIVHERKVELAFENHRLWDMKRWRLAHVVWNGSSTDLTTRPGVAREPSTRVYSLWPYKIYNPGNPNHNKWVFRKILSPQVNQSHNFRQGNYYTRIPDGIINNNPLLVRNPNQ